MAVFQHLGAVVRTGAADERISGPSKDGRLVGPREHRGTFICRHARPSMRRGVVFGTYDQTRTGKDMLADETLPGAAGGMIRSVLSAHRSHKASRGHQSSSSKRKGMIRKRSPSTTLSASSSHGLIRHALIWVFISRRTFGVSTMLRISLRYIALNPMV